MYPTGIRVASGGAIHPPLESRGFLARFLYGVLCTPRCRKGMRQTTGVRSVASVAYEGSTKCRAIMTANIVQARPKISLRSLIT